MHSLKKFKSTCLAAAITAISMPGSAETVDATRTLPDAKPGECYAKVVIPAQYKTEQVDVTMREASARFETTPADYQMVETKVLVKEAAKKIVPVPAEYETVVETVQIAPAQKQWRAGKTRKARPANPALLSAIGAGGIKLDELPVGSCLSEYYVPAQYKKEDVRVLKTAAYEKIEVEPAAYEMVEEKVLVKEASKEVVEVPAEFERVQAHAVDEHAHGGQDDVERTDDARRPRAAHLRFKGKEQRQVDHATGEQPGNAGRNAEDELPGCQSELCLGQDFFRAPKELQVPANIAHEVLLEPGRPPDHQADEESQSDGQGRILLDFLFAQRRQLMQG